ncbi:unnamed protein product [Protopolystoma xenopodis]|uniref:Uncharacterized protein n=1 Tax=Protopolystoma xenopodis TaxID=117903 RepID=A0A448X5D3_9PLAT|nr:unnamed protein product [Protopolystoma xenopodis]
MHRCIVPGARDDGFSLFVTGPHVHRITEMGVGMEREGERIPGKPIKVDRVDEMLKRRVSSKCSFKDLSRCSVLLPGSRGKASLEIY